MARQLTTLDPEEQYRAVVFFKFSGPHNLPLETYTDGHTTYQYHRVRVFGPYEKPGTAKGQVNREKRHAEKGYSDHFTYDPVSRTRTMYPVAEVEGFVESSTPRWGLHVG